jgi:hypothetical protein
MHFAHKTEKKDFGFLQVFTALYCFFRTHLFRIIKDPKRDRGNGAI